MEIDPTSIPGNCPLNKFGSTNREALKITTDIYGQRQFDEQRLTMLRFLVEQRWNNLMLGEATSDPLKVFVKQEPHKQSKLDTGRLRLITAVSLVDTIVDRILFGEMLRTAVQPRNLLTTPCVVGWSPTGGGWRYIQHKYPEGSVSIDRTAWDWTVRRWLVFAWKEFLFDLHPNAPQWWRHMVSVRFEQLFLHARYRFSDGVEILQDDWGIMKSGCLLTLFLNSVGQTLLHSIACLRINRNPEEDIPLCAGDDTIQNWFEDIELYAEQLNRLCITKEVVRTYGYNEFVGFFFSWRGYVPAYWEKHLFCLRHADVTVQRELLQSYQYLWYNDPIMLGLIRNFAYNVDPHIVLSDRQLESIANG